MNASEVNILTFLHLAGLANKNLFLKKWHTATAKQIK